MKRLIALLLTVVALVVHATAAVASGEPPSGQGDDYRAKAGRTLRVLSPGILANDFDPEGDDLTAVLDSPARWGDFTFRANGSFKYVPGLTAGWDWFTYRAFDGETYSDLILVTIKIDTRPVAAPDSYGVLAPGALSVAAPGILENDTDMDGDLLSAVLVAEPWYGRLVLEADGSFTYTPDGKMRDAFFKYRATDGGKLSPVTRVDLIVRDENTRPVANPDTYIVQENSPLSVLPPGVLENDTDADGDPLIAELVFEPFADNYEFFADGSFNYLMPTNWDTDVPFTYRVWDGFNYSAPTRVTIDIIASNSPPTGQDDYYEFDPTFGPLFVPAPGVLENDYDDVEFDTPHVHDVVGGPGHGDLTLNTDGSFWYTPDDGFFGRDGFSYRPADSQPGMATNVTIEVLAPPDEGD